MEKFALLDFLKAFESLTGKASDAPDGKHAETEARPQSAKQPVPSSAQAADLENNAMANVIARHEEIANRVKNKRSV